MRSLLRVAVVSVVLGFSGAVAAVAAETHGVAFCFNDWPPYAMSTDDGAKGLSVDILREAARRAGLAVRFVALPWKRCLQAVEAGEVDAVMDAADRPEFIHGAVSYTVYTNTFWVRTDDPMTKFDAKALAGRRLGLVAGYVYGDALDRLFADSGATIEEAVDDGTNIRKLAYGRTDIIVADFVSTHIFAADNQLDLRALQPAHSLDRLYPSFNPARRETMAAIDTALQSMCADGWIERAYEAQIGIGFDSITGDDGCSARPETLVQ